MPNNESTAIHWLAVLNPYAGSKRLKKDWGKIVSLIKELKLDVEPIQTKYKGHAVDIVMEKLRCGYRHILVFGGDGTLNEVVNGVYKSDIEDKSSVHLALIPYGTGNDWARFWHIKKTLRTSLQTIVQHKTSLVDVGCMESFDENGKTQTHYFLNAIGMGFDAQVVKIASVIKNHFGGGSWSYSLAVILAAFIHRSCPMNIKVDGKTILENTPVFTLSIGNGCYTGGGLKQTPDAIPYDGFFQAMVVNKLSFRQICLGIKYLFSSRLLEHPCIHAYNQKKFEYQSTIPVENEADGVQLGSHRHVCVSVIPNALTFVVP